MSDAARAGLSPKNARRLDAIEAAITKVTAVIGRADLPRRLRAVTALLLLPALLGYVMAEMVITERAVEGGAPVSPARQAFTNMFQSIGVLLDRAAVVPSVMVQVVLFLAIMAAVIVMVAHIVESTQPTWLSMLHISIRCAARGFIAVPVLLLTYTQHTDADLHPAYLIVGGAAAVAYLFAPGGAITSTLIARIQSQQAST